MMMIVLRLLSLLGLKSRWHFQLLAPEQGCFSCDRMSVDSWTPGPKPLSHRHPTGPHPSGLLWTPAKSDLTKSNFAPGERLLGRFGHRAVTVHRLGLVG